MMPESNTSQRRYAVLTEGSLTNIHGKTAHGILRYRPDEVAVVIDSQYAGQRINDILPHLQSAAPIVASMREALHHNPTSLLVGVATDGGRLPEEMRAPILKAVDAGLEIVSGLHESLCNDPEIVERATKSGSRLRDVRTSDQPFALFSGRVYDVGQQVVLAVGSDCAVGKMTAMLEIERAAKQANARAKFIATGQTGIMITGSGIAVDAVISDFVTGAAEQLVLEAPNDADVLLIEGQGSIFHPAYAPVTLGLLYGCAPDALILCHRAGAKKIVGFNTAIPELTELIRVHEEILKFVKPARVAAILLDTSALTPQEAHQEILLTEQKTGLPTDDAVRNGGAKMWNVISSALRTTPKSLSTVS